MHGHRTDLFYGVTLDPVLCLITVDGPSGGSIDEVDDTHLLSVGLVSEWEPGVRHAGNLGFTFAYNSVNAAGLYSHFISGEIIPWRLVLPDLSVWDFTGYISSISPNNVPENGRIVGTATVKISGAPVFTPG